MFIDRKTGLAYITGGSSGTSTCVQPSAMSHFTLAVQKSRTAVQGCGGFKEGEGCFARRHTCAGLQQGGAPVSGQRSREVSPCVSKREGQDWLRLQWWAVHCYAGGGTAPLKGWADTDTTGQNTPNEKFVQSRMD